MLERNCEHVKFDEFYEKKKKCTISFCENKFCTSLDCLKIEIGFTIFILFNYLKDYFPEEKEKLYLFLPDNEEDEVNDEEKNH